jgi:hypothetical protein
MIHVVVMIGKMRYFQLETMETGKDRGDWFNRHFGQCITLGIVVVYRPALTMCVGSLLYEHSLIFIMGSKKQPNLYRS